MYNIMSNWISKRLLSAVEQWTANYKRNKLTSFILILGGCVFYFVDQISTANLFPAVLIVLIGALWNLYKCNLVEVHQNTPKE